MDSSAPAPVTAILLAGSRPGVDPLAAHFDEPVKALIRLGGRTMIDRVVATLAASPAVGPIIIAAQDIAQLQAGLGADWCGANPQVRFLTVGDSVSGAVVEAIAATGGAYPYLVTTADNALLDAPTVATFVHGAAVSRADVAVALVERRTLLAAYPANRRTWLKFRGGAYSGANLFWFGGPGAERVLALWRTIEQQRKRGRAVIGAFGPLMLAAVGLRILTLHGAMRWAGRRLGVAAAAVVLDRAEACIDVDSLADHALAEAILAGREPRR